MYGRWLYGASLFAPGGEDAAAAASPHPFVRWRLEVRSRSGALLATLPAHRDGLWIEHVNKPNELRFRYPYDADRDPHLFFPNQVWVYDGTGVVRDKCPIVEAVAVDDWEGAYIEVAAQDLSTQLKQETVVEYDAEATVSAHLAAWLHTEQVNDVPIKLGGLDAGISGQTHRVRVQAASVYHAVQELHKLVGGMWWVSPDARLHWRGLRGRRAQRLRVGRSLRSFRRKEDPTAMFNRLYLFGKVPRSQRLLRLTDAGHGTDYIDGRASSISAYGYRVRRIVEYNIKDAATLLARAKQLIDRYDTPLVTYSGSVLDLYRSGEADFAADELTVGSAVPVYDEKYGITATLIITRIAHDLTSAMGTEGAGEWGRADEIELVQEVEANQLDAGGPPILQAPLEDSLVDIVSDQAEEEEDAASDDPWQPTVYESPTNDINDLEPVDATPVDGDIAVVDGTPYMRVGGAWKELGLAGQVVRYAVIQSEGNDHLDCKMLDYPGATPGDNIAIAKVWYMRKSALDGGTISFYDSHDETYAYDASFPYIRTATDADDNVQSQRIVPEYFAGEIILYVAVEDSGVEAAPDYQELAGYRTWMTAF